jgi:glucose/arabinose dehydrogenase
MRNPWRFSFDRETGDLWIGDVGQNAWEEIDRAPAGTGGQNFGWNTLEGTHPYPPGGAEPADVARFTMPVVEYPHPTGESVTGGYVYRGSAAPSLEGVYLYGDYVKGKVWGFRPGGGAPENTLLADTGYAISSFGEGPDGELYICDIKGGAVYRIGAAAK